MIDGFKAETKHTKAHIEVIRKFEKAIGKELWAINAEELQSLLAYESDSYTEVYRRISTIRKYMEYVGSQHPELHSDITRITEILDNTKINSIDITECVRSSYVKDVQDILYRCRNTLEGSIAPVVGCLFWEGLDREEIANLMEDDLTFEEKSLTIKLKDKTVVSRDPLVISTLANYISTYSGILVCRNDTRVLMPLGTDGHLLKKFEYQIERAGGYIPYHLNSINDKMKSTGLKYLYVNCSRFYYDIYNEVKRKGVDKQTIRRDMFTTYYSYLTFFAWYDAFYKK